MHPAICGERYGATHLRAQRANHPDESALVHFQGWHYFHGGRLDLEALRARLQRMSERELRRFGQAALYMCSPKAKLGKEPRQVFVIQSSSWRRHQCADQ